MTRNNDWLILRPTQGSQVRGWALRLPQSLAWAGIEAWSPSVRLVDRDSDNRTRRPRRFALMPNYVFAKVAHLHALMAIREDPMTPHPPFKFMTDPTGQVSGCADKQLNPLRLAERKAEPIEDAYKWQVGERVTCQNAGFEGLVGTIERVTKKDAWVNFGLFGKASEVPTVFLIPYDENAERKAA